MVELDAKLSLEGANGGDPIETLNNLIRQRSELLKQSVFQATAAAMVNALKSIRTTTRDAKKHKKFNIKVELMPYYVGFSGTEKKPCLRTAPRKDAPKATVDGRIVFLTNGIINPLKNAHVYKVTQEKPSNVPLYIACRDEKTAENYAIKASQHRVRISGTLAKDALGVAVARVAETSFQREGGSKSATTVAVVTETRSEDEYTLKVQDNLDYSTDALNGGEAAIDIALKNAANKTYGYLAHLSGLDFTEQFPEKPFPEVGKKK